MSRELSQKLLNRTQCMVFDHPISVDDFLDSEYEGSIQANAKHLVESELDSGNELAIFRPYSANFDQIQEVQRTVEAFDGEYHIFGSNSYNPEAFLLIVVREK